MKLRREILHSLCILLAFFTVCAKESSTSSDKFDDYSFEDLFNVKVVSAGKRVEAVGDISASIDVITREDIELYGHQTLLDVLNSIQGVYISKGLNGNVVSMRGLPMSTSSATLAILVNNVRIRDNEIISLYSIPVEFIDKVEVIRGPMSIMYGSDALVGAINIVMDDISGDAKSTIGSAVGTNAMKSLYLSNSRQKGAMRYLFNAYYTEDEGKDIPLSEMSDMNLDNLKPEDQRTKDKLSHSQLSMFFSGAMNDFYMKYYFINNKQKRYFFFPSLGEGYQRKTMNNTVLFGYEKELFDKFSVNAYIRSQNISAADSYHHFSYTYYGSQKQIKKEIEAELDIFWKPTKKLQLMTGVSGLSVYEEDYFSDIPSFGIVNDHYQFVTEDSPRRVWAVFEQIKYAPFEKLKLVGGIRLEQKRANRILFRKGQGTDTFVQESALYPEGEVNVIPSAAAIVQLNEKHLCKLMFGKAIRDNHTSGTQVSVEVAQGVSSVYLEQEESYTTELNYVMNLSKKLNLNVSVFHTLLDNIVVRRAQITDGNFKGWFENEGKQRAYGSEFLFRTVPLKGLNVDLGGSYINSQDEYLDVAMAFSPTFMANLNVAYTIKKYSAALSLYYVDEMEAGWNEYKTPIIDDDVLMGFQGGRYGDKADDHFLLNLNLRAAELFGSGLFVNVNFHNILDQEIRTPTGRSNSWANKGELGDGLMIKCNLGYHF